MINLPLTDNIRQWLDTPSAERDLKAGAELLLRVSRNRILYNNIIRALPQRATLLEHHLRKILNTRLVNTTREEVRKMMVQVDDIAARHGLSGQTTRTSFQNGKRADHDSLPEDVKQLYVENADIMRRMRDTHTRLRMINPSNSTCPDSDRYPLAKALIGYDRRYRDNWNRYDHYVKGTLLAATQFAIDPRTQQKNALKTINLLLGKYAKKASDAAAERIKSLYAQIPNPPEPLVNKMRLAQLL